MKEKYSADNPYSEDEAWRESERLKAMVDNSGGQRDYDDAERLMKRLDAEERPGYDKEKFAGALEVLGRLTIQERDGTEQQTSEAIEQDLDRLSAFRNEFVDAYDYEDRVINDLIKMSEQSVVGGREEDSERLCAISTGIIADLSPKIVRDLKKSRLGNQGLHALFLLTDARNGTEVQKNGVSALVETLDVSERILCAEKTDPIEVLRAWRRVRYKGDREQAAALSAAAARSAQVLKDSPRLGDVLGYLVESKAHKDRMEAAGILIDKLNGYGLPALEISRRWSMSDPNKAAAVRRNLKTLMRIEQARPGIGTRLHDQFGLAVFGRYPDEVLIAQFDEADDLSKPYGAIVYPYKDWNGAFNNDREIFSELFKELDGKFALRAAECDGRIGLIRTLIKLDRRYNPPEGSGHRIGLGVIGGHGNKNEMQFGEADGGGRLKISDLKGRGAGRARKFFEDDASLILVSCSTGAEEGIGQDISEKTGLKVVAPAEPACLRKIKVVKKPGGKFIFAAEYHKNKEGKDIKKIYVGGVDKRHPIER